MKFAKRKTLDQVVELNITAFMNLMVILVPFLLITAVFSRMSVIELNLPALDAAQAQSADRLDLSLELVIRETRFDIQDQSLGQLHSVPRTHSEQDWENLTKVLMEIKSRYPEEQEIMLLPEPSVTYKTLIRVMDEVIATEVVQLAQLVSVELFPNISISDAPALEFDNQAEFDSSKEKTTL